MTVEKKEPVNLPVKFPRSCLAQGAEGIAVGLSTPSAFHIIYRLIDRSIKNNLNRAKFYQYFQTSNIRNNKTFSNYG